MSEEQLTALLAKLKEDAGLREKLQGAADLDAAVAIANEAGFEVTKFDLAGLTKESLSDEELDLTPGGGVAQQFGYSNPRSPSPCYRDHSSNPQSPSPCMH